MPLLIEAMPNGLILPCETGENRPIGQTPNPRVIPCRGVVALRTNPDCQRRQETH
jgi:hypothetical protein